MAVFADFRLVFAARYRQCKMAIKLHLAWKNTPLCSLSNAMFGCDRRRGTGTQNFKLRQNCGFCNFSTGSEKHAHHTTRDIFHVPWGGDIKKLDVHVVGLPAGSAVTRERLHLRFLIYLFIVCNSYKLSCVGFVVAFCFHGMTFHTSCYPTFGFPVAASPMSRPNTTESVLIYSPSCQVLQVLDQRTP